MDSNQNPIGQTASSLPVEKVKLLILGAGPAGLTAALYAARAELSPLLLTGMELGGQASLTHTIENYPGFPDGIGGGELGERFQKQAEKFGARLEFDVATEVNLLQKPFAIRTYGKEYQADSLVVATGASPNKLGVPGEKEFTGKGVSYCATCDGWFFKDKAVAVVGGGDSALEEAIFLTRYASSVTIVHRRDAFRAGVILQKRAASNPKIHFIYNTALTRISGEKTVQEIELRNLQTNQDTPMPIDGVFIFIGHTPNTSLFQGQLAMNEKGYLLTTESVITSIPGVYAAGEVADSVNRQVITSAGMGAAAAIRATHFLESC